MHQNEAGVLLAPPFRVEIGRFLTAGVNRIEIEVTPALRNRLEGKARAGDVRYREFTGSQDMLLPGGLEGPVTVEVRPRY